MASAPTTPVFTSSDAVVRSLSSIRLSAASGSEGPTTPLPGPLAPPAASLEPPLALPESAASWTAQPRRRHASGSTEEQALTAVHVPATEPDAFDVLDVGGVGVAPQVHLRADVPPSASSPLQRDSWAGATAAGGPAGSRAGTAQTGASVELAKQPPPPVPSDHGMSALIPAPPAPSPLLRIPLVGRPLASLAGRVSGKYAAALYTSVCLLGYGLSFFINSITGHLVGPQHWSTTLMLNSSGRFIMLSCVLPLLWFMGLRPAGGDGVLITRQALIPTAVAIIGSVGFVTYMMMLSGGSEQVSVITPMIGLYSVIPVGVGLFLRGEEKTVFKLAGILLSLGAVLLLGFSGDAAAAGTGVVNPADVAPNAAAKAASAASAAAGYSSMGATAVKWLLFFATFVLWGLNDVLSSNVKLDAFTIACGSLLGQLICATVMALISAFVSSHNAAEALRGLAVPALQALATQAAAYPAVAPASFVNGTLASLTALARAQQAQSASDGSLLVSKIGVAGAGQDYAALPDAAWVVQWQLLDGNVAQSVQTALTRAGGLAAVDIEPFTMRPFGWAHAAIMGANALAIIGWLAFVRMGQIGQASSFVPITSLYSFVPIILSVVFLGESLNAMKAFGILLAAAAVLLISTPAEVFRSLISKARAAVSGGGQSPASAQPSFASAGALGGTGTSRA